MYMNYMSACDFDKFRKNSNFKRLYVTVYYRYFIIVFPTDKERW